MNKNLIEKMKLKNFLKKIKNFWIIIKNIALKY